MLDFNSHIPEQQGLPQLDKDYWKNQNQAEEQNPFDNIIETNLRKTSIFKLNEK